MMDDMGAMMDQMSDMMSGGWVMVLSDSCYSSPSSRPLLSGSCSLCVPSGVGQLG
jgi:hypothetical protein